ncbi:MAG: LytTR family transcriptional regulator DNA-binding domain-containing protein [Colwellia sp.]|uniref:7TM diverse intracellular signaling domain-containing protein n=1 Tax=Colwellia sp. TaxID=56799 RepID=UPI0025C28900|nr:7TM diverse intracellular signaling domain-containing protein [Colwellia sp.]NQZ27651.1 LytTR family transcriptional regulator DNA-binding domain-containing protein [Colwellia sp.]
MNINTYFPKKITDSFIVQQLALFTARFSFNSNHRIFIVLLMAIISIGIVWLIHSATQTVTETAAGKKIAQSPLTVEVATFTQHDWDIEALLSPLNKVTFEPHQGNFINLGSRDFLWLTVTLPPNPREISLNTSLEISLKTSTEKSPKQTQILVLKKNRIYTPVELHYLTLNEGWAKEVVQGSPQFHQNIVIRLPNEILANTFYLKLHGRYLRTSLYLFDDKAFFDDLQQTSLVSGLFYGMLLLFSLYHLMLYLRLKEPSYLAYSVMLLLLGSWFLSGQGWIEYFLPNATYLKNMTVIIGGLLIVSIGEFAKHYLQISTLSRRIYKVLVLAQLLLLLLLVARLSLQSLLPASIKQLSYGLGLSTCFIIFIACFSAAIIGVKKQKNAAGYYLTATILFFVMATIMGLSAGNIIDFHFSWPLLQMTSAIEIIIFSAGLVSIYYQQQQNEMAVEIELQQAQQKLVKQLEISNQLKDKVLNNVVDHKLFPELAKVTAFLPDIIYVQALGNDSLVVYKKNHRKSKIELACNLQNLLESFGDEYLIRIHKSYLVNPLQVMSLQRRTSADYDLQLGKETVPVGRKYLNEAKKLV